jgi:hypothetical protein
MLWGVCWREILLWQWFSLKKIIPFGLANTGLELIADVRVFPSQFLEKLLLLDLTFSANKEFCYFFLDDLINNNLLDVFSSWLSTKQISSSQKSSSTGTFLVLGLGFWTACVLQILIHILLIFWVVYFSLDFYVLAAIGFVRRWGPVLDAGAFGKNEPKVVWVAVLALLFWRLSVFRLPLFMMDLHL